MDSQDRLYKIAQSVNWFEDSKFVLDNRNKFLSYAMKYATMDDVIYLLELYGKDSFSKALDSIYNKVLDSRSKAYFYLIVSKNE